MKMRYLLLVLDAAIIIRYSFIVIIIFLSFIPKLIFPDNVYMFLPIFALGFITSLLICIIHIEK